ncbi:MAG: peptide chain release factor-like protein [Pirellulales bacterium]|nr:peptide chain release factor-like protein [Pirellulales bacterium]
MCHPARLPVEKLLADCRLRPTRRSGPGGQHRNKVQTAVVIEHLPTGLRGEASERRSQADNRRQAIQRLRVNLALSHRHPSPSVPPQLWQQRIESGRIAVNSHHEDFSALLSIALDAIWAHEFAMAAAAEQLEVTTSQLIKFLKMEQAAIVAVNRERQARGKSILR